jgi:uncharacterized protein
MAGGASKLRDVRKLADSRSVFELELPLAQLPGLPAELTSGGGEVRAQLRFGREQGFAAAEVKLQTAMQGTCQRCLQAMRLQIEASSQVLLVESEQEAERSPGGWETFLAPEGRLTFEALVAEELLLALPIVTLHQSAAECPALGAAERSEIKAEPQTAQDEAGASATARPFADLRALLERGAKS